MPAVLPFIPLIAAGIGAAGLADTIYNQVNAPSSTPPQGTNALSQAQIAQQQANQQKEAFLASQGNTQASTGGSLTPGGFVQQTGAYAGQPLDMQAILKLLAGGSSTNISGGSTTASPGQTPNPTLEGLTGKVWG